MAKEEKIDLALSDAELKALEEQAVKEVEAEMKAALSKDFLDQKKLELKKKALFKHGKDAKGNDVVTVRVDLAPNSSYITLDGRVFFHGHTYKFTKAQADVISEQMHRGWMHEAEIHGMDSNAMNGRRQVNAHLAGEA